MNLVVVLEHRFMQTSDGQVWATSPLAYDFWRRYLPVFATVRVVSRIRDVDTVGPDAKLASGERVEFLALPDFRGPREYLRQWVKVRSALSRATEGRDAVILRVPCATSSIMARRLQRTGRPYGLELAGDPSEALSQGAVKHPLRPAFRWWFAHELRRQCLMASAAAYVTQTALQCRYPPGPETYTTHYSTIDLPPSAFVDAPRPVGTNAGSFTLVTVGSLEQLYKAVDVQIDAVLECIRAGLDVHLVIIGDGKYRPELEARAARLGLEDQVQFMGRLPAGDAVQAWLDRADLFLLPSRTEGLPRALIEAMARGVPCIGSTVGGIPELLPAADMVPPNDHVALAAKIREVLADPQRMAAMSERNWRKAMEYRDDVLRERRIAFYHHLKERTEGWLKTQVGG